MSRTLFALLAGAILSGCAGAAARVPAPVVDRELTIGRPTDIRWDGDDRLLISDLREGIARVTVTDSASPEWLPEWPAGHAPGSRYMYIGRSGRFIAAADLAFGMRWLGTDPGDAIVSQAIEYVADLDVHGDRLLVAGLRRDENGQLGADGAFAWTGSFADGALRPVLPFTNRAAIENCAGFHLATVRFLSDGSFVIVPGAEPGVYLYDAQGRLKRNFATEALNLVGDCELTREEQSLLSTDAGARQRWINRRRIIDEVVELPSGPALIVRTRDEHVTRWELVPLATGEPRPLPVTSASPWAHVAADARGGRIALLLADRVAEREGGRPPRLVLWQP